MITLTAAAIGQYAELRVLTDLPGDTPITVTRTMQGATSPVRGADELTGHGGAFVLADWEVLYQTPLTYQATGGGQASDPATIVIDEDRAWLRSVLVPELSLPVWIEKHEESSRAARTTLLRPIGRRNPVAITDTRGGQQGSSVLITWDDDGRIGMQDLLADGGGLLLTGPAGWRLGPLYLAALDVTESRPAGTALETERRWTIAWAEIDPPPGNVLAPAATYTEVLARGTYADIADSGDAYVDVLYPVGSPEPPLALTAARWP